MHERLSDEECNSQFGSVINTRLTFVQSFNVWLACWWRCRLKEITLVSDKKLAGSFVFEIPFGRSIMFSWDHFRDIKNTYKRSILNLSRGKNCNNWTNKLNKVYQGRLSTNDCEGSCNLVKTVSIFRKVLLKAPGDTRKTFDVCLRAVYALYVWIHPSGFRCSGGLSPLCSLSDVMHSSVRLFPCLIPPSSGCGWL